MKLTLLTTALLLTLSSAATIRNHFRRNCAGGHLLCRNINPNVCCGAVRSDPPRGSPSAFFASMPHHATVLGWQGSRDGRKCGALKRRASTGNGNHKCLGIPPNVGQFAGTSWVRGGRKRDVGYLVNGTTDGLGVQVGEVCNGTVGPDAIVLDDGHMYGVEGMGEEMVAQLYDMAMNGTGYADLPEVFDRFEEDVGGVEGRVAEMQGETEDDGDGVEETEEDPEDEEEDLEEDPEAQEEDPEEDSEED